MINLGTQFLDRLFTMFNLLLIVAGILEYILLAIDFKVSDLVVFVPPFW
jgi:hypothetical protein